MPAAKPRTAKTGLYVVTTSGSAEIDGVPYYFVKGEVLSGDHPLVGLKGAVGAFLSPVEDRVEQATAAPGEKRGED